MSSENRVGNPRANHCPRHGDFIGYSCPVCDGVQRRVRTEPSKSAYRKAVKDGILDEVDD